MSSVKHCSNCTFFICLPILQLQKGYLLTKQLCVFFFFLHNIVVAFTTPKWGCYPKLPIQKTEMKVVTFTGPVCVPVYVYLCMCVGVYSTYTNQKLLLTPPRRCGTSSCSGLRLLTAGTPRSAHPLHYARPSPPNRPPPTARCPSACWPKHTQC